MTSNLVQKSVLLSAEERKLQYNSLIEPDWILESEENDFANVVLQLQVTTNFQFVKILQSSGSAGGHMTSLNLDFHD